MVEEFSDNFDFSEIIDSKKGIAWFVGAGISMEPPTNLVSSNEIIEAIIKFCIPDSDEENILNIIKKNNLRFEYLIDFFYEYIDLNSSILEYFTLNHKTNDFHDFFSDQIMQKNIVITTNFDNSIEKAFIKKSKKKNINVVSTDAQFKNALDALKNDQKEAFYLFKIHGNPKNIINGQNLKESVIFSLKDLGKKGNFLDNQISADKTAFLEKILQDCILVFVGYSGSDVIDLIPTLKSIEIKKPFIWIDHTNDIDQAETIKLNFKNGTKLAKDDPFLQQIGEINHPTIILRGDSKSILIKKRSKIREQKSNSLFKWLKKNIESRPKGFEYLLASRLYFDLSYYNEAIMLINRSLNYYEKIDNEPMIVEILLFKAEVYNTIGQIRRVKEILDYVIDLIDNLQNKKLSTIFLLRYGDMSFNLGAYDSALSWYQDAVNVAEENDEKYLGLCLEKMSDVLFIQRNIAKFREISTRASEYYNKVGDIRSHIRDTSKTALSLAFDGLEDLAVNTAKNLCKISQILGIKLEEGKQLENFGDIYAELKKYDLSYKKYKRAAKIYRLHNLKHQLAKVYLKIGGILHIQKKIEEALSYFDRGLEIFKEIGNDHMIAEVYLKKGKILRDLEIFSGAREYFEEALKIEFYNKTWESLAKIEMSLGDLEYDQGNINDAKKHYNDAYNRTQYLNSYILYNLSTLKLGKFLYEMGDLSEAQKIIKRTQEKNDMVLYFKFYKPLKDLQEKINKNINVI